MGAIRKTTSIATLGLVSWTSRQDRLREAEAELVEARTELERTTRKEALLKERLLQAERKVEKTELHSLKDAKAARKRGARKAEAAHGVGLAGLLDNVVEDTKRRSKDVRRIAELRAAELEARTERTRRQARKRYDKATRKAVKRGDATREQLVTAAEEATASLRARAKGLTHR